MTFFLLLFIFWGLIGNQSVGYNWACIGQRFFELLDKYDLKKKSLLMLKMKDLT
jgi:hypothetical protein